MSHHNDATQDDREALEPCPFCGGDAYLANPEPNALWRVICANNCGAGNYVSNRTAAIAVWNHRLASTAALQAERDALAAMLIKIAATVTQDASGRWYFDLGDPEQLLSDACAAVGYDVVIAARDALGEG